MSLDAMLAAHDETALEAVANKGLVRRAQKDVSNGALDVLERAEDRAVLSVETQTVELTSDGPMRASCTCPANTVCRHIIGAVLFLRDSSRADGEQEGSNFATNERTAGAASDQPALVRTELSALPQEAVSKFAGADLQKALEFAAQHQGAPISDQGATSIVRFPDELGTVTFIAGQGLQGAISKGPKSKSRLLVAAAALLLRRAEGVALPDREEVSGVAGTAASVQLNTAYLKDVLIGLENALTAVMSGTPELAEETLFDLAISARAQAAPRLSSVLRRLTKSARLAREHHIDFSPEAYLQASANTYALVNALIKSPGDYRLTGVLRRNYQPREDLSLIMLGAYRWKAESGARGLTILGYSPSTREWYSTTNARAAGADSTFTPFDAYFDSIWRQGRVADVIGRRLELEAPSVADGNEISFGWHGNARKSDDVVQADEIVRCGALNKRWSEAASVEKLRSERGLRAGYATAPVLIAPTSLGDTEFDEIRQRYLVDLLDADLEALTLEFDAESHDLIRKLRQNFNDIHSVLVLLSHGEDGVVGRLISVIHRNQRQRGITSIDFDRFPEAKGVSKALAQVRDALPRVRAIKPSSMTGITRLIEDCERVLVEGLQGFIDDSRVDRCLDQLSAAGMAVLEHGLRRWSRSRKASDALRAAHICDRARTVSEAHRESRS